MAPFYQRYKPNFRLHKDDILGIQSLYGEALSTPSPTLPTVSVDRSTVSTEGSIWSGSSSSSPRIPPVDDSNTEAETDLCQNGAIDAVTRVSSGRTFVFKGDYYWRVETTGLADGYPRRISDDWGGLPGNLDAAVTWADGKTFFFKVCKLNYK